MFASRTFTHLHATYLSPFVLPNLLSGGIKALTLTALTTLLCLSASLAQSQSKESSTLKLDETPRIAIHAQTTWIGQSKPGFNTPTPYSDSANMLSPLSEEGFSMTVTADVGLRLWKGAQLHINPESARGRSLSKSLGMASIPNGELQRGANMAWSSYRARMFLMQRWNGDGDTVDIEPDFNEMGGKAGANRWTLVAGNFSLLDFFDANPYSKDPRSQFMNWSFLTHGAWDYAADARGYTQGVMLDYTTPTWALRFARTAVPVESNGYALDEALGIHYGDQIEFETDLPLRLQHGPMRGSIIYYRNKAQMFAYKDAAQIAGIASTDYLSIPRSEQTKTGYGITLMAPFDEEAGVFFRYSKNDGQFEQYNFVEIDQQWSVGGVFTGKAWGRGQDRVGVALATNDLSQAHRDYFSAGGKGFFVGDGVANTLNYAPERTFETWYRWSVDDINTKVGKLQNALSVGWQYILNPGYNQDRGPMSVYSVRWHSEF